MERARCKNMLKNRLKRSHVIAPQFEQMTLVEQGMAYSEGLT